MKDFQTFWSFIEKDNPIWYEFARTRFFSKDIKKCAQDAYAYLIADLDAFNKMTPEGIRKYMVAWLIKAPDAPQKPQLQQEGEAFKESENFLTGEARQKKLQEFKDLILQTPPIKPISKISNREIISEGQWEPKKEKVHQNGIDQNLILLKERIKMYANEKYKDVYSFTGFSTFKFGLVEVFAKSLEDAKEILQKSEL